MAQPQPPLSQVEPISDSHQVNDFDCGTHESRNTWLKRRGVTNQNNESART
jgi:hypothetical protein